MMKLSFSRHVQILLQWAASLSPAVLVVVCAWFLFKQAVISSIDSTPHPELVYAILGTFFIGVLLTCATLYRYTRESNLALMWLQASPEQQTHLLASRAAGSYLLPILQVLSGQRALAAHMRQGVLEQEVANSAAQLDDRMSLPHYLAGALVGLGLVGTFVGLLGTLEDLGKLFASLGNTDSNANPADLFGAMVQKLQDPMKGMGTAFVASLYGLLGSLVLGLQILIVSKIAHGVSKHMQILIRESGDSDVCVQDGTLAESASMRDAASRDQALLQALASLQAAQTAQSSQWSAATAHMKSRYDEVLEQVMIMQAEQTKTLQAMGLEMRQLQQSSLQETQILRREMLSVVEVSRQLTSAVRDNVAADVRYRESVPRTTYWQNAWVKVQAYLQRANTDQVLSQLTESSKVQESALVSAAAILARIDQRLGAQLSQQITAPRQDS